MDAINWFVFWRAGCIAQRKQAIRPHDDEVCIAGVEDEGGQGYQVEEPEADSRKMDRLIDPMLPSAEEFSEHNLSHLPFRNWRPHASRDVARR